MLRPSALLLVLCPSLASASDVTITDLLPGSAGSYPSYLTVHNGDLYFRANGLSGGTDVELCRYDGVTAERIADINPGPEGSAP